MLTLTCESLNSPSPRLAEFSLADQTFSNLFVHLLRDERDLRRRQGEESYRYRECEYPHLRLPSDCEYRSRRKEDREENSDQVVRFLSQIPNFVWKQVDFPLARKGHIYSMSLSIGLIFWTGFVYYLTRRDAGRASREKRPSEEFGEIAEVAK